MFMPPSIEILPPRKIAFAGDWHGNISYGRRAISYAIDQGADVILHLGDFGIMGFFQRYLDGLTDILTYGNLNLYFLDGNHEDHPRLAEMPYIEDGTQPFTERIFHLPRGYRWQWDGVRFLALGGAHSVDRQLRTPGMNWWPEELVTGSQAMAAIQGGRTDVMLTHDAPAGWVIPDLESEDYWPPEEIRTANQHRSVLAAVAEIVQPTWLFHGHYHVRYTLTNALVGNDGKLGERYVIPHVEGLALDGSSFADNVVVKTLDELKEGIRSEGAQA
jgi:predicted phosphodiesterase